MQCDTTDETELSKEMKKIKHWFLFYSMLYFHSGIVTAHSMIFDEYVWTNRLVIMITDKKNSDSKHKSTVFESHICDIEDRNLKLLHFQENEVSGTQLQKTPCQPRIRRLNQGF